MNERELRRSIESDGRTSSFRKDMRVKERSAKSRRPLGDPRPPAMWNAFDAEDFPPAVWGQYPKRFVPWALTAIGATAGEVLHVCSGSLPRCSGVRVDLRETQIPDVCADGAALPFRDATFGGVLIDPPYSREHAAALYGTPDFSLRKIVNEALRVVRPSCAVGVLAHLVPFYDSALGRLERVVGVTTGCGYKIRAFTVLRRHQQGLWA